MKELLNRLRHVISDDELEIIPALIASGIFTASLLYWLMEG